MVLNEKSVELMVVNGVTGEILGHHSIPLFRKENLAMAYLVVCADETFDGEQGQYLVNFSDIIYVNEQHALAVRACIGDEEEIELSPDEYTELIGLPVCYDDGVELGRLAEIQYNTETGEFEMAVVESDTKTTELLYRQIKSADNTGIIVKRRLEEPAEKTQPSRVWFRRPTVEASIPAMPTFEVPAFEEPVPEKTPEEIIEDENARAIASLDALLRDMEGIAQPDVPAEAAPKAEEPVQEEPKAEEPAADPFKIEPEVEPVKEEPAVVDEKAELEAKFAPEPEEPAPAEEEPAEEEETDPENVPLYQQKFAGAEEEEKEEAEESEQGKKKGDKKEKGGAKSLWKFGF